MTILGFIRVSTFSVSQCGPSKGEEENAALLVKLWGVLEGDQRGGVSQENLKIVLAAVMKIALFSEDETVPSSNRYGKFSEDGIFSFGQAEATRIHKDFTAFFHTKSAYSTSVSSNKPIEDPEYTFKPALSKRSVEMATSIHKKFAPSCQQPSCTEMLSLLQKGSEA